MADETFDETGLGLLTVHSTEMDFVTAIEHDCLLPIAFRDRPALDRWLQSETNLKAASIGRRDQENNVAVISGKISVPVCTDGLSYSQVWASIKYTRYRDAVKVRVKTTEGALKDIDLYDCDHAVAQTRLSSEWPDAWVNMVLVESGINRAVGAMMEKEPLRVEGGQDFININAECVLKTFLRREGPLNRKDVPEYLRQARERFLSVRKSVGSLSGRDLTWAILDFSMSQNADCYFDDFCRELGIEQIDWGPQLAIIIGGST